MRKLIVTASFVFTLVGLCQTVWHPVNNHVLAGPAECLSVGTYYALMAHKVYIGECYCPLNGQHEGSEWRCDLSFDPDDYGCQEINCIIPIPY